MHGDLYATPPSQYPRGSAARESLWADFLRQRGALLAVLAGVLLLGAPAGLLWAYLTPDVAVGYSAGGQPGLLRVESTQFFTVDGYFLITTAAAGAVSAVAAWAAVRRGPFVPVVLAGAGMVSALIAREIGGRVVTESRLADYCAASPELPLCGLFDGRLVMRSPALLLSWAFAALATYLVLMLVATPSDDAAAQAASVQAERALVVGGYGGPGQ